MPFNRKKILIISTIAALAIAAGIFAWNFYLRGLLTAQGVADVEFVSVITGLDGGITDRFAGIVEPQDTFELFIDSGRRLKETYVEPGEEVLKNTPLLEYETESLELEAEQKKLNALRIENTISSYKTQIQNLTKQRTGATGALQLEYTQQIQSYEASVKQEEYNLKVLELEIDKLYDKIDESVICSPFDGVVQSLNEAMLFGGGSDPYIVVNALGGFRVRGEVSELNVERLEIGAQVIIRSRLSESAVWSGEISKVDLLSPISGGLDPYAYDAAPSTLQSTRYPFYVTVINYEGLLLGQHVYVEPNISKMSRDGLWLLIYYIQTDDSGPFVWAVNRDSDRLERRHVTLGGYDADKKLYEIKDGLDPGDEIAWPTPELKSGMAVRRGSFAPQEAQPARAPSSTVSPSEIGDDVSPSPDSVGQPPPLSSAGVSTGTDISPPPTSPASETDIPPADNAQDGDILSIPD